MVVTNDGIAENEEEKSGEDGESELEHRSDDGDDEEGLIMDDKKAYLQDDPDNDSQSVDDSLGNRPRRAAAGRGINFLETTIGVKTHDTKTGMHFF